MLTSMPWQCEVVMWFMIPAGALAFALCIHHTIVGARRFGDRGWEIVRGIFSGRYAR